LRKWLAYAKQSYGVSNVYRTFDLSSNLIASKN
jgi:hypothetical protein